MERGIHSMNENIRRYGEELKLFKETLEVSKNIWKEWLTKELNKWILSPCGATTEYIKLDRFFDGHYQITVKIGFWNEEESKLDFGSTFDIYYSLENGLEFNHGMIGTFNSKNKYQLLRMRLMGHLYDNLNTIEDMFFLAYEKSHHYRNYWNTIIETENKIKYEEEIINNAIKDEISERLKVGDEITGMTSHVWRYVFNAKGVMLSTDKYFIEKITPKYVSIMGGSNSVKVKKELFLTQIMEGKINIR